MSSLLIIGGSGFFGKSFLDAFRRGLLREWGISEVLILSRNASTLQQTNPELISCSVQLIDSDISLCSELPTADFVIHAAASSDASRYLLEPENEKFNIQSGTRNYCNLAKQFHMESRIIYISSGAVYGFNSNTILEIPETFSLENSLETMSANKIGYAEAKRESEMLIKNLGQFGLKVSIARCFAFVGKYLPLDQHYAIGNFLKNGLEGNPIEVKATNQVYRSYMYADDLVLWLMSIMEAANDMCPIYNVGSNERVSISELAILIGKKTNQKVIQRGLSSKQIDAYLPSIIAAEAKLGLKVNIRLEESIDKTLHELQKNH